MFYRVCPNCGNKVFLKQLVGLLKEPSFRCAYCAKDLKTSGKYQLINAAIYGFAIAIINLSFFRMSVEWMIVISVVSGHFLQKYLDILFPLVLVE